LSSATGAVLDPVFALRRRVLVAPGAAARVDFWTMVASSRDAVLKLVEKYNDTGAFERAVALAWTQAQVQLYHIGISRAEAGHYQRLASQIIYATPKLRLPSESVVTPKGGQPGLWPLGISGDLPILVVRIADGDQLGLAHEVLQALEYWRLKRLAVDVVILNERGTSYAQDVQSALETLVRANQSRPQIADDNPRGHCFLLRADLISAEARALLLEVARVVLTGERGKLTNQLDGAADAHPATRDVALRGSGASELQVTRPPPGVEYFNGLGGFAADGREYVTILSPGQCTPAPWINVIANAKFGFQVSAEGSGYAWSVNSQAFQLTPWCNDPVIDRPGQVIYLRDEVSGEFWTPTASPIRDERATYVARHGWGYSCFEHESHGIASSLLEYVPLDDTVKISRLTLRNASDRPRRISVSAYIEWVLGKSRSMTAPFVATRRDPATGALLANNSWTPTYAGRVAFADLRGQQTGWTCDRREFIGRNGALDRPAALLTGKPLSGRSGSGLDPCAALQTSVDIAPGASVELTLLLGDGANEAEALALITRYRKADLGAVLQAVRQFWAATTGMVQVRTPDRSMDIMLNGWLTYQVVSCRIWARAAFYQASGAYGFRDQLQDCMAVAGILPAITRAHLLRAAGRQFVEGDVQHWWLPETGQGVRTTISDDRAWLAYATAHYIQITGDTAVLDEMAGFLTAEPLAPGEADSFSIPGEAPSGATLYEHCARALDSSLTIGAHGMPLIGGGDWNDGMNRVGAAGRGESVWLGWLLHTALGDFVTLAEARGDHIHVARWRAHQAALATAFETQAWDGDWYKRGWFDDGSPLGAAANEECRIDCIAQSWAVLSGAAPLERATKAMAAVDRELISSHDGLALLFTPPFDRATPDPGYIRGYPPGVRENGGQYTHAALWSVMAFAALGEGDKATALFWMLNPINHSRTRADTHRYKVEPYVIAADVYAAAGHVGRGGWTWYTGSAGWTQRAGIESILGLRVHGAKLHLDPCIPASWPGFDITLKHASSRYLIHVDNQHGVQRGVTAATLDGKTIANAGFAIPLCDDGADHVVRISMG